MNSKLVSTIEAATQARLATAGVNAPLVEVANQLSVTRISLVVICAENGTIAGVITKTDIVKQLGKYVGNVSNMIAADVMTRDVTCCAPDDCLPDVLAMMRQFGFVHLPVVDDAGNPVGVVNARDALRAMLGEEKYEAALLRDYVMGVGYQ